jgi:hypothetical protein
VKLFCGQGRKNQIKIAVALVRPTLASALPPAVVARSSCNAGATGIKDTLPTAAQGRVAGVEHPRTSNALAPLLKAVGGAPVCGEGEGEKENE